MMTWFRRVADRSPELDRDARLAEALDALDPASDDPDYWFRFHGRVMTNAGPELARRRMMANLTVVDVLASWSRTVVPTAMLAVAVAALMLVRAGSGSVQTGAADDFLTEVQSEPVPVGWEAPTAFVGFASEIF